MGKLSIYKGIQGDGMQGFVTIKLIDFGMRISGIHFVDHNPPTNNDI